jgi:hypothetical protein
MLTGEDERGHQDAMAGEYLGRPPDNSDNTLAGVVGGQTGWQFGRHTLATAQLQ